ncbi:5-formyltetrahydrofolate cyclo-ligase [Fructilactobacillus fructivorans]|uniref:5-formyltetrahydrofolate cyclo-ligase n=1 Tax=Fructilactobacillus fructivorans TaxID=1614 RepID=A0A0C1PQG1_9LACO|nr:5-formyltetrahydrofolate cyclo-ligase [Fructilactobacillus fructivorans]KID42131.1 5-formyltetrahydrofolate cyclo-ligase [Fructilactobacillus fructivorans]MCT0152024.1 5-formyltetrahydrofolate cyclo-ligase [Fructilactobacillus fructivorans]MCT2867916.1 5-formyltetrahydrofolate cyclo-ligase [Fructilactobacillus fructivorans]MCT2868502.1 5-formyltetrahydrofolate cyclo-ligase [Fructilactobacillus fructivorans]MCT2873502.1 5-formyltetrahydrofolate cyclo-ligase [Fructilactobacillus fructivorans]
MNKDKVRKQILNKMEGATQSDQKFFDLYVELFHLSEWNHADIVATTMNTTNEIPTAPIIFRALGEGKRIVVPRTLPNHQMEFVEMDHNLVFQQTRFGIWEPVAGSVVKSNKIDLMIVPGVAFNPQSKQRIGYGAGFYDRYLSHFKGYKVALAQEEQIISALDWKPENFDVKLDQIIYRG